MPRSFRSFRSRMIVLLALSMGLAGLATNIAYKLLQAYYTSSVRFEDESVVRLRQLIRHVGDFNFFLLFFIPLAVLFFYALSSPYARYFQQISGGIRALAEGDFERRVEIRSGDEFQSIAEDLGQAGDKLRQAVRRGDFAESSKDQLVLNLAHDLRTPLTSVVGYLDYVLKDDGLTPEQTRHYLGIAASKAQRLERLIDELFEVTRLQHGQLPLERAELDLAELLSQLSEEMQPLFEKNGLEARLELEPPLLVQADGDLLARVFENLAVNAARYGGDGRYVDFRCFAEGDEAVAQIVNYGSRIEPEELPHLFDMFYTGDKSRQSGIGGTGIGLFIAQNIVERHGGTIAARSDIVRTVFEVRLPRDGASASAKPILEKI